MRHRVEIGALGDFIVTLHGRLFPAGFSAGTIWPTMICPQIPSYIGLLLSVRALSSAVGPTR